jgi:HSP20 family protein
MRDITVFSPLRDFDRFFEDFGYWPEIRREVKQGLIALKADLEETDKEYLLHVDVPGVNKEDVKLEVNAGVLTISGERKFERKGEERGRSWSERSYGRFQRSFTLPDDVDAGKVLAEQKNGVLTVKLPKSEVTRARQIPVQ